MDELVAARFWAKVAVGAEDECWEWQACRNQCGYGMFHHPGGQLAHRFAYELANGGIDPALLVMHSCDNPPCVNAKHLSQGTVQDNNRDRHQKGRTRSGVQPPRDSNVHSRFTSTQVNEMVDRYRAGETQRSIGAAFGARQNVISKILRKHAPDVDSSTRRARGIKSANGKLTDDQVRDIRSRRATGETQQSIADSYGVSQASISAIVNRITFKYLE